MLKKIIALSISVVMLSAMAGCDVSSISVENIKASITEEQTEYPVQIGHDIVNEQPRKIVVLDDNTADILIACGYTDNIIGRSSDCTQTELKDVKEYGSDKNPRTDLVNKLDADVIFASSDIAYSDYESMKSDDKVVLRMAQATSIDNLETLYSNVCRVMSGNISGKNIGTEKAKAITDSLEKAENKNSVIKGCYLFTTDGRSAVTTDMYENEILQLAGIQNIATDEDKNGILPVNKIISADKQEGFPFYILCEKGMKNKILSDDNFKNTNVVNKNRVIEIPSEYISRQGNTAIEGVAYIANEIKKQSVATGKSLASDYGIELFEGISYTLDEEDSYVLAIQQRLDDLGYLPIEPTGYFGESTAEAVKEFQVNNELNRRDGVADKETLERLFSTSAFSRATPIKSETPTATTATEAPTEAGTFAVTVAE